MPPPWTRRTRAHRGLENARDAFPTPPTARLVLRKNDEEQSRACARATTQTILTPPTAWPGFKRSSLAAFERSVTMRQSVIEPWQPTGGSQDSRFRSAPLRFLDSAIAFLADMRAGYFSFDFALRRSAQYFFIRSPTAFRAAADILLPR